MTDEPAELQQLTQQVSELKSRAKSKDAELRQLTQQVSDLNSLAKQIVESKEAELQQLIQQVSELKSLLERFPPKSESIKNWRGREKLTDKQLFPEVVVAAILLLILSFSYCALRGWMPINQPVKQMLEKILVALWLAVPPVWFWFEWSLCTNKLAAPEKEDLKHSHELSRNLWAAIVILLTLCLFGHIPISEH
jgi:hypothetical protein